MPKGLTPAQVDELLILPEGTPQYMAAAYYGCLRWALGNQSMQAEFHKQTGAILPPPPRSQLDKMVDEASGVYRQYIKSFKKWHDENVWGKPTAALEQAENG